MEQEKTVEIPDVDMDLSLRLAVQNVLRGDRVDGAVGRTVSVLQCVYGCKTTFYQGRNSAHSIVVGGVVHSVPDAVDRANGLLKRLGLFGYYIAYPGAKTDPLSGATATGDRTANDNFCGPYGKGVAQ
ncbi:hypothetical protein [Thalassospira sp. MCCC 1A01428]|uniref:hypothetical protein n=1 Tax=Thalassospira sp. MCCC 1A01428 TaxID=1470575 RepID=UPI000A1DD0FB|nr:hypothetical protein [Thalassospira sp. MCCC 1A01428]OSQ34178.1 hypothetical protein THS27_25700 [Thalassospira sp. MCCC 1A01428]